MLARNGCRHGIDASISGYSGIDVRIGCQQHRCQPTTGSGTGIDAGISSSIEVRIGCHLDVNICVSTGTDRCRRLCRPPLNLAPVSVSCAAPYARSALWVAVPLLYRCCTVAVSVTAPVIVSAAVPVVVATASAIVPAAFSSSCRFRFLLLAAVSAAPAAGRPKKLLTNCNRLI